jgi:predicted transcriptional regulator
MATGNYTIELPRGVAQRVVRAAKRQNRNPSDVAAEAILWYFSRRKFPIEAATPAELRAVRLGEAAFRKGDYVTLNDYFQSLGNSPRRSRKKISRTHSVARP